MSTTEKECDALAKELQGRFKGKLVSFDVVETETSWVVSIVSQESTNVVNKSILKAFISSHWSVDGIEGAESRGNVYWVSK